MDEKPLPCLSLWQWPSPGHTMDHRGDPMGDYDLVIIGGGAAGLTAGIYGARNRLRTVVLEQGYPGGQAASAEKIENYPGFPEGVAGLSLMQAMIEQARRFGAEIVQERAIDLRLTADSKQIVTDRGLEFRAKAVILACGVEPRPLNIAGERELRGRGVSYCATCDAFFFQDRDVVVVGSGDTAIDEAIYLTRFASRVRVIAIHDQGVLDCNRLSAERALANTRIEWFWNSVLEGIRGEELVQSVHIRNLKSGRVTELPTRGVFIFVGTMPQTAFLAGQVQLDDQGYIIVDEQLETSVPGVFAAGDARAKYLRQVITAAADGAVAASAAGRYLAEAEDFNSLVLGSEAPVMAAFWSPRQQSGIELLEMLERTAESKRIKLFKIDTRRGHWIAERYGVRALPALLFFQKRQPAARLEGSFSQADVIHQIERLSLRPKSMGAG
jgi:thioredoxin reductase (NADPH)